MAVENIIALAAAIVALLSMGISLWQARAASIQASSAKENEAAAKRHATAAEQYAAAASEQTAVMREQLAESRLRFRERFDDLTAEVSMTLEGSVRASHTSYHGEDVIVITVSEELDKDLTGRLAELTRRYGYDCIIDVRTDLIV